MYFIVYIIRVITILLVTWVALRLIGKKSIAQITSYELAGIILLTNVAAEPLTFKVVTKASIGTLAIAIFVLLIGYLSLRKKFYDADMKPELVVQNGKVDYIALKKNKMNVSLLLSMLRLKGYANISDVEFAVIEPNGQISAISKADKRPLQPSDMQIQPAFEGLPLPVIVDGEIQYGILKYINLTPQWLTSELKRANIQSAKEVFLAQVNSHNELYLSLYKEISPKKPPIM